MALTRRQREIYDFIRSFVAEKGYSPSLEEIGAEFGLSSVATVHKHVHHLVEKGFLRKSWNRSRSVEPVESSDAATVSLPLLGFVAAGAPIEAVEVPETIEVPKDLVRWEGESFVLRVRGTSMIEEQIRDGDYIVVQAQDRAEDGQMVVALVSGVRAIGPQAGPRGLAQLDRMERLAPYSLASCSEASRASTSAQLASKGPRRLSFRVAAAAPKWAASSGASPRARANR